MNDTPTVDKDTPWTWCVADSANPDRRYSLLDVNHFPPEFGPFETRQQAEDFAGMRPAYYLTRVFPSAVDQGDE